jgi:hypothetical protein
MKEREKQKKETKAKGMNYKAEKAYTVSLGKHQQKNTYEPCRVSHDQLSQKLLNR